MSDLPERVTMRDVAEKAGVSRSAVSRTFTEGASVAPATRKKVMAAAKALDYSPNVLASSLTTRRTKLIGLVGDNFMNPVFLVVFELFTKTLQEKGFRPLVVNLAGETQPEASLELLKQYSVDGVIVASSTLPTSFAAAFRKAGVPVVHVFGRYAGETQTHVVGVDNVYCGRLAAETLLDHGYRKLGFLGGPETAISTQDRLQGFQDAVHGAGHSFSTSFADAYNYDAGVREMTRLIEAGDLADAYFCGDDQLAIGAMDALDKAGIKVPDHVGIIGMNDMDMSRWGRVALTTISQPFPEITRASIDLIVSQIESPAIVPETRLLPCELVLRKTLRPL